MDFKDFSDTLRENLYNSKGNYASFINYSPDLFSLLCDILDEEVINQELRMKLTSAIAYFVIPNEVISEETSELMREILESVVSSPTGSGKNAYIKGYRIGGKTGTSEKGRTCRRS